MQMLVYFALKQATPPVCAATVNVLLYMKAKEMKIGLSFTS